MIEKWKFQSHSRLVVVTSGVLCCGVSLCIVVRIVQDFHETDGLLAKADALREKFDCLTNESADREICVGKYGFHWKTDQEELPKECNNQKATNQLIKTEIDKKWKEVLQTQKRKAENQTKLDQMVKICYSNQDRFHIHWFPDFDSLKGIPVNKWHSISSWQHNTAVYTVSCTSPDTYYKGNVRIQANGVHLIYAKMTANCLEADNEEKRIFFEVRLASNEQFMTLLRGEATGVCNLQGDLLTLFQQGSFQLGKNDLISVRVKLPRNVGIAEEDFMYKTSLGVVLLS